MEKRSIILTSIELQLFNVQYLFGLWEMTLSGVMNYRTIILWTIFKICIKLAMVRPSGRPLNIDLN